MNMQVRNIYYDEGFVKQLRRLPWRIQKKTFQSQKLFREDPFYPSLRLHKLHGKFEDYWSISLTRQYRIIFFVIEEGNILFVSIGTHSIYDNEK